MRILLTNDDGIQADGLAALEAAMRDFGDVFVVAPRDLMSGCSHRVTTGALLAIRQVADHRFAVAGAPADCVRVALTHLALDVDWIVAGINAGGNLGVDIHMSGTVAAVREAALFGKPGIAFSQYRSRGGSFRWPNGQRMAASVFRRMADRQRHTGEFWNVNFPDREAGIELPDMIECEPDPSPLDIAYEQRADGLVYRGVYQNRPRKAGFDVDRCFRGYITLTRLSSSVCSTNVERGNSPRTM